MRSCIRTYMILKEKAACFNADASGAGALLGNYIAEKASALKARSFDLPALGTRGIKYERLDQLTVDLLLG